MARNSEKAMTALARWRRGKEEEEGTAKKHVKRPYLASECDSLQDAERWRQQTIRDISKSVTAIQNAGLGEFRIRDLNDHINKLLREKKHWENRIRELGGKSYSSKGAKMLDREGKEVPGNKGYKYFGAARDLPGVRELFECDAPVNTKKTRAELMKDVDAQYYGFRDDEDGILVPLELKAEKGAIARIINEWKGAKAGEVQPDDDEDLYIKELKDDDEALKDAMEAGKEGRFSAHVKVPTQADIEEALLRRKKQELLELFAIDHTDLDQLEKEAKLEEESKKNTMDTCENQAKIEEESKKEETMETCENQISQGDYSKHEEDNSEERENSQDISQETNSDTPNEVVIVDSVKEIVMDTPIIEPGEKSKDENYGIQNNINVASRDAPESDSTESNMETTDY